MPTEWYQQALTPPEVIQVTLRIGIIPDVDHAQVMVEAVNPVTSVQIAAWSSPHGSAANWQDMLEEAVTKAREYLGVSIEPF